MRAVLAFGEAAATGSCPTRTARVDPVYRDHRSPILVTSALLHCLSGQEAITWVAYAHPIERKHPMALRQVTSAPDRGTEHSYFPTTVRRSRPNWRLPESADESNIVDSASAGTAEPPMA